MGFAVATLESQPRNHGAFLTGVTPPLVPSVALSLTFSDIIPDPVDALTWQFTVLRSGNRASDISVAWAVAPGGSPIPASAFVGGVHPSGTVAIPAGQTSGIGSFQTAAGLRPSVDQFATLALLNPSGCTLGSPVSATLRLPGQPIPVQDQLGVICPDTSWPVDAASHAHTVTVVRTNSLGTYLAGTQVRVRLVGTGANPIAAADISGGLLDSTVTFLAGETSRAFTVTTLAGTAPSADKTGRVAVSAPVGGQLAASGTFVDVAIPHAVVVPPTGVLPPQYTDPNWTGMGAYALAGGASPGWADLQAACAALSGKAACKTTFIELPAGFDFGTATRALPYKGFVDAAGKIYPLIIRSVLASIGDRSKVADLAHFRHLDLNGATWLWLHGLAVEVPLSDDPFGGTQFQNDFKPAIETDGSTDCLITRCWLDAPSGIHGNTGVRTRIGANDFYGTTRDLAPSKPHPTWPTDPWTTQLRFVCNGKTPTTQTKPDHVLVYQNFMGNLRPPFADADGKSADSSACFYQGEGVEPAAGVVPSYPDLPYDLNPAGCWFFDNLILCTRNFLVYNKHAWKVWRNRVVAIAKFNHTTGTGSAFHYLASRGSNWIGGEFKYNSTEGVVGDSSHCDFQVSTGTVEFNDFNGIASNLWVSSDQPDGKGLVASAHWRFRGNTDGHYQIGMDRCDGGYAYNGPMTDIAWEGEQTGDDGGPRWTWIKPNYQLNKTTWKPAGTDVQWSAAVTAKNTEKMTVAFPGDTAKLGCDIGELSKSAATAAVPQLTTAHADADYPGEFTQGKKGIAAKDANCLVWDYVGAGGGGGTYALVSANWATHLPVDNTDYAVSWLAGGGVDLRAGDTASEAVGLRLWCRTAEPAGAKVLFTFLATRLDAWAAGGALDANGIFALFVHRYLGTATGYPASPADWPAAKYQGVGGGVIDCSDDIYRPVGKGYRHSFANAAQAVDDSFQFRLRTYNGGSPPSTTIDPTSPSPIPAGGTSFRFTTGRTYRLEVTRDGNGITAVKTDPSAASPEATQTWTFSDPLIGGLGAGGYCGFGVFRGSHVRIEPVAGVPFCQAVP